MLQRVWEKLDSRLDNCHGAGSAYIYLSLHTFFAIFNRNITSFFKTPCILANNERSDCLNNIILTRLEKLAYQGLDARLCCIWLVSNTSEQNT